MSGWERDEHNRLRRTPFTKSSLYSNPSSPSSFSHSDPADNMADEPLDAEIEPQPIPQPIPQPMPLPQAAHNRN